MRTRSFAALEEAESLLEEYMGRRILEKAALSRRLHSRAPRQVDRCQCARNCLLDTYPSQRKNASCSAWGFQRGLQPESP
jgi:hypothetical protein